MKEETNGLCGAIGFPDGSVYWRLWAPRAKHVDLVLIEEERRRSCRMTAEDRGYFVHREPAIAEGQRYAYRLDGGPGRPDPASLWQPEGVHRPSAVLRPERFPWSESSWKGVERQDLVFYELHVGTFTPEGTFDAVIPRLAAIRELGVTAIELMPVAQFPGTRNWGYDGVHLYAPQDSYGGPHGLQRLVNACHASGLAIFLDVVYNHLGPEGNYLHEFGPYFAEHHRTFWGPAFNYDAAGCDPVRAFVLQNVWLWIGAYRLDGLRLDAVHAIFDNSPRHILRQVKECAEEAAGRLGRISHVIAESNLNDVRLIRPQEAGGYNLDAQWNDDFHHMVHSYLTGEHQGYYVDFGQAAEFPKLLEQTFVLDGGYSRFRDRRHGAPVGDLSGDQFVISVQNHDQVGNRAQGDRLACLVSFPAQKLAASLMLLAPYLPLLFMGEEYGERNPFLFFCSFLDQQLAARIREGRRREFAAFAWQGEVPDPQAESSLSASRLTWSWPADSCQAGLRRLYCDLLAARRSWPALRDFKKRAARLLPDGERKVLRLIRGGTVPQAGATLRIDFNLTDQTVILPAPHPDTPSRSPPSEGGDKGGVGGGQGGGEDALLFSSEAKQYGGERGPADQPGQMRPFECLVYGPQSWEKRT